MSSSNLVEGSYSKRCAACKHLRRRCAEDCILAPYFPATHPERFECVHKIFGAGNVARMLKVSGIYIYIYINFFPFDMYICEHAD
jgi:Lateral organ boundaries (LOB) domain